MKRILLLTLLAILLLPYRTLATSEATTTDRARMRNAPSTINTATLLVIPKGAAVTVFEETDGWSRLSYGNKEGWTASWLLKPTIAVTPQTPSTATLNEHGQYISAARVRSGASLSGAIVTTLSKGTGVDILEEVSGWYRVRTTAGVEGFTATWLITKIPASPPPEPTPPPPTPILPRATPQPQVIDASVQQVGVVPSDVDLTQLSQYWLEKVNSLRREKGLRELVLDQRFVNTASEYAGYMGTTGAKNHERADGKTMHQWIDSQGLAFTKRYSAGGWQTNYFSENISWGYASGNTEAVKKVLDDTMDMYLAEASYNGAHYRTTYHPDWNVLGVGFYFKDEGDGRYQVFCVFHYGSLTL